MLTEWILTLTHINSGAAKQYVFAGEFEAKGAKEAALKGEGFWHKAGYTIITPAEYCEFTVGPAQAIFDQLQWFSKGNMMAQTLGQHEVQAYFQAKHAAENPPQPQQKVAGKKH